MKGVIFSSTRDAASVREICEAAGITKPTSPAFAAARCHRRFADGALEDFRRQIDRALAGPGNARTRLKRVARTYFDNARARHDLVRFIYALIHNPPSSAPGTDFPRFYDELVRGIAAEVERGVAQGEFTRGRTDLRMLMYMGALGEALCGYLIVGRPEISPALADALVDAVTAGWRTSAEVVR